MVVLKHLNGLFLFLPNKYFNLHTVKAFLTFFLISDTKGRQTLFQLVLWVEEELRSICMRERSSHRVKVQPLAQRMCDFYQLAEGGEATCGVTACTDLHPPQSLRSATIIHNKRRECSNDPQTGAVTYRRYPVKCSGSCMVGSRAGEARVLGL